MKSCKSWHSKRKW